MAGWIGAISAEYASNWDICKAAGLFGTTSSSAGGAVAGDELFIWQSGQGWMAHCMLTADAFKPGVGEAPWPEPARYRYVMPMRVISEQAVPTPMSQQEMQEELDLPGVRLPQFPKLTNTRALDRLRRIFPPTVPAPSVDDFFTGDTRLIAQRAIAIRRGQSQFRQGLIEAYDGSCAISGSRTLAVLEAAHIDPYRGDHTNHTANGLLLRADVHTLFDLQLITVLPVGVVRTAPDLAGSEYEDFDERLLRKSPASDTSPDPMALARHNAGCDWL
jgi:putative restriction endonuclease